MKKSENNPKPRMSWRIEHTGQLLTLLARASISVANPPLLGQYLTSASALHWRVTNIAKPLTNEALLDYLSTPITEWLPRNCTHGFKGCFLVNAEPGTLTLEVLSELLENPLLTRDNAVSRIEASHSSPRLSFDSIRTLVASKCVTPRPPQDHKIPKPIFDELYEPEVDSFQTHYGRLCGACGFPVSNQDTFCASLFCTFLTNVSGSLAEGPPTVSEDHRTARRDFPRFTIERTLWKSIICPLLIEPFLVVHLSSNLKNTPKYKLTYNPDKPGLIVTSDRSKFMIEPVGLTSPLPVHDYYTINLERGFHSIIVTTGTRTGSFLPLVRPLGLTLLAPRSLSTYIAKHL